MSDNKKRKTEDISEGEGTEREEEVKQIRKRVRTINISVNPFELLPQKEKLNLPPGVSEGKMIKSMYKRYARMTNVRFVEVLKYLFYDKEVFGDTVCLLEGNEKSKMWLRSKHEKNDLPYDWTHDIHIGKGVYGSMAEDKGDIFIDDYKMDKKYEGNIYDTPNVYNEAIMKCIKANPNIKYLLSPIGFTAFENVEDSYPNIIGAHANVLILDISKRGKVRIERYEPHGAITGLESHEYFDTSIKRFLDNVDYLKQRGYIYYKPQDYCIAEGMQAAENVVDCSDALNKFLKDKNGYCALWSIVYMYMRVHPKTQDMDRAILARASSALILQDTSLCEKVAKFAYYMLEPEYKIGRHIHGV